MLRDLDKRKSAYPQHKDKLDSVRITPAANSRTRVFARAWVWLVAVVGLLFLAALVWHFYDDLTPKVLRTNEPPSVVTMAPEAPATEVIEPAAPVAAAPAFTDILAIDVQDVADGARLEIRLSAAVQHRVLRDGQHLIIDLPATRLAVALPNLTRNRLINAVDVLSYAGGTQLEVDVEGPVNLQTSLVSQQQVLLVIQLIEVVANEPKPTELLGLTEITVPKTSEITAETAMDASASTEPLTSPSFEKTTRQLSLAERDQRTNKKALQHMRAGRIQTANQLLSALIKEYPQAHESRATLIALTMSQGYIPQAEQLLAQGLQLAPQQLAYIKLKARLLLDKQQAASAVALLSEHEQQAAGEQEFLALLATASQRDGQHQRAVTLYQQLLAQNDRQAQWWIGQAISLEALQQKNAALQAYLKARQIAAISPALKVYAESRIEQLN